MVLTAYNKENVSRKIYHTSRDAPRRTSYSSTAVYSHVSEMDDEFENGFRYPRPSQTKHTTFPKHLQRPAFRRVTSDAISAVDPDLKGVALQFIHQKIQAAGPRLFAAAQATAVQCPKGRLPRELQVIVNDVSVDMPTHVFAVYSHPSALQNQAVAIHPAHALILAANCANLPPIPAFKPRTPAFPGSAVRLPVIPLCIPNPATFPILLDYMYTREGEHLLRTLLPATPSDESPSLYHLARLLADSMTVPALLTYVYKTQGLWSNVAALGISDEQLWRAMDVAWQVLRDALAMRPRDR